MHVVEKCLYLLAMLERISKKKREEEERQVEVQRALARELFEEEEQDRRVQNLETKMDIELARYHQGKQVLDRYHQGKQVQQQQMVQVSYRVGQCL